MPIEFNCTNCGKLLRVPDGSEGKQGKCKDCNTVLMIPSPASPAPPAPAAPVPAAAPAPAKPAAAAPFPGIQASPRDSRLKGANPAPVAPGFSPAPAAPAAAPMASNPYSSPASLGASVGGGGTGGGGLNAVMPLKQAAGWMLFIGWFNIIFGVLYALTIVGILFAWLPIWIGICLKTAGESLKAGLNDRNVHTASKNLGTFFTIIGVLMIIQIAIMCLYLLVVVGILVFGLAAAAGGA